MRFAGSLPKQEQSAVSNEDRFAFRFLPGGRLRAAVADGASSMLFSGEWAELLSMAFVEEEGTVPKVPALESLRHRWFRQCQEAPLPWHQQLQVSLGTAAAFLGVDIEPSGRWRAVSVGDCALFQIHNDCCVAAFPVASARDLTTLPTLLLTHPEATEDTAISYQTEGVLQARDSLFLMTDALAAWFLQEANEARTPWRWLGEISTDNAFAQRIRALQQTRRLKDDDITLIHIVPIEEKG